MPLDLSYARSCFPALDSDWAFFDNAGGSQTLGEVGRRIQEYLTSSMVAQGGPYPQSQLGQQRLENAGRRFATFLNATDPGEVILGSSTTQLLQHLGQSLAETLRPGDRIVMSEAEHHSNIDPWERLAASGCEIVTWKVNRDTWRLELDDLKPLLTERTRLVSFTHCSNILGTLHDVAHMTRFIHDHGAQVLVDGVAYAPHDILDVRRWDVDYYVFSSYKTYGPHHAALYGKRKHLLALPGTNFRIIPADRIPYKFQPGNANPELSHGATAIMDYIEALGTDDPAHAEPSTDPHISRQSMTRAWERIRAHEAALSKRFLGWLQQQKRVRIFGLTSADRTVRVPTISFTVDGIDSQQLVRSLAQHHIGTRAGSFYALGLERALGFGRTNGVVRISMVHTNTFDEVDRLIRQLEATIHATV